MVRDEIVRGLVNTLSGTQLTLGLELERLRLWTERDLTPPLIHGYVAAEPEIFREVARYIRKNLGIDERAVLTLGLQKNGGMLVNLLAENVDRLNACPGDLALVKVKGFEVFADNLGVYAGHCYDQSVRERSPGNLLRDLVKKTLVLTHIGHSAGSRAYRKGIATAGSSQFKYFLWEF